MMALVHACRVEQNVKRQLFSVRLLRYVLANELWFLFQIWYNGY